MFQVGPPTTNILYNITRAASYAVCVTDVIQFTRFWNMCYGSKISRLNLVGHLGSVKTINILKKHKITQ